MSLDWPRVVANRIDGSRLLEQRHLVGQSTEQSWGGAKRGGALLRLHAISALDHLLWLQPKVVRRLEQVGDNAYSQREA